MDRRNLKTLLVCVSGIDGSGKTTLCHEVVTELKLHEIPSRYVYGRFLPALTAPFFKVSSLMLHKRNPCDHYSADDENKKQLLRNPVVFKFFLIGVLIDQLLRILLKICLPSIFKSEVIVCDRYLFDTIVTDVALTCGFSDSELVPLTRQWLELFPKADVVFVVNVPPRVAYQRKSDLHSIEVLEQLSKTYLYLGERFGATIIDGTRDTLELKHLILNKLRSTGIPLAS